MLSSFLWSANAHLHLPNQVAKQALIGESRAKLAPASSFSGFCSCNCSPPPTKPSRKAPSPPPKLFFESLIGAPVEHISQLTIFRAESAPKVSAVFVVASAHLHLPTRIAKHLRHKFYSFWNLLPEHRSNSITHGKKNKRSQDEILRTEKCPAKIVPVRVRKF